DARRRQRQHFPREPGAEFLMGISSRFGLLAAASTIAIGLGLAEVSAHRASVTQATPSGVEYLFNDSHFHLTNYIQEGTDVHAFLKVMGTKTGRSTLFGIPLQQTWSYGNTGDFAPWYYTQTDAPLYYYSFTDAYIAMQFRSLSKDEQGRFDP